MTKNIWAAIITLVAVIGCGIVEVVFLSKAYKRLRDECGDVMGLADRGELTAARFDEFRDNWVELRETSELLLPHQDVYEINLRFAEAEAYVKQGDYKQVNAQLAVVWELLEYVPHLMSPNLRHIV